MTRITKWIVSVLTLIVALTIGSYFIALHFGEDIIKNTILKKYNEDPNNPYYVEFSTLDISLSRATLDIQDIQISLKDSLVTLVKMGTSDVPNSNVNIAIGGIHIDGFNLYEAFQERKLKANKFSIMQPHIVVHQYPKVTDSTAAPQDTVDIRSVFLANFDTFRLNTVEIVELATQYYTVSAQQDTQKVFGLENLSYAMYDVVANKQTLYSEDIISFSHYGLETHDMNLNLPAVGKITVEHILYQSVTNSIRIKKAYWEPNQTPDQKFYGLTYRKPWISFGFQELQLTGFNLKKSLDDGHLQIGKLFLDNPSLGVAIDLALPFKPTDVKPMLSQQIASIPIPVTVDSIVVKSAKITAKMKGANTRKYGVLAFYPMHIQGTNITNYAPDLAQNSNCVLHVQTKANGTGDIRANLAMNLASSSGYTTFNVDGRMIDVTAFNRVLSPIMRVSVTEGSIETLTLRSVITDTVSKGYMDTHYEHLYLVLENKDSKKKPTLFQQLASGLANGVLKNDNIPGEKHYHTGNFQFEKGPHDSFFKLLWLVHLYGLEDSILGSDARDKRKQKKSNKEKSGLFSTKKKAPQDNDQTP